MSANPPQQVRLSDHLVYLLVKGRVKCVASRTVTFTTYIEGSYFGDIEYFTKFTRQFSVVAMEKVTLVRIEYEHLEQVNNMFPGSKLDLIERTFARYFRVLLSMHKSSVFSGLRAGDLFWSQQNNVEDIKHLQKSHREISEWLEVIIQHVNNNEKKSSEAEPM